MLVRLLFSLRTLFLSGMPYIRDFSALSAKVFVGAEWWAVDLFRSLFRVQDGMVRWRVRARMVSRFSSEEFRWAIGEVSRWFAGGIRV